MWSDPEMRARSAAALVANSSRIAINPGISVSAIAISLRPQSASERSATLKSAELRLLITALIRYLRSIVNRNGRRCAHSFSTAEPRATSGRVAAPLGGRSY